MAKPSSLFPDRLIESQLMGADAVRHHLKQLQAGRNPVSEKEFATALVKAGELTLYQARAIYQGKGKNLILGNYVILDKIGVGGMGRIYRAKHQRMDRVVALKVLPPELTDKQNAIQRFHREVRAAARLSHPNIVMAYDADVAHGLHFMVMEYVAGSDLSSLVKEHGRISVTRAVNYICQAARGLEYAHTQNVIHRDIKPGNLILDHYETVRILDMGLARLNDSIRSASNISLTKTNVVMGTVDFMSPEQALNSKYVDERGDIYSLGMTLHYLLTGKPAYGGETAVERLLAHRDSPLPSLLDFRSDVDARLNSIFQKMVAKKPDDRYQSMVEVIRELDSYMLGTKPEPVKTESQCKEDANLKAFLLSLETVPAFVPNVNQALFDTSKMMSELDDTHRANQVLNLEQSVDRESIVGRLPVTDSATDVTVVPQTNSQVPFAILGAAAVLIIALLLFKMEFAQVTTERPASSTLPAPAEIEPTSQTGQRSKQADPISVVASVWTLESSPPDDPQFEFQNVADNLLQGTSESYALHFNGRDQYAEIPELDLQNFPLDVPLTIEAKVCPDSFQKLGDVISWLGPNWIRICQLTDMNEQNCWVVARRIDDRSVISSAPQTVRPGEWVDLAAVWDGREFTLFLDGKKQEVTKSAFPVEPTEGGLFLGGVPLEKRVGQSWFDGAIRQVRISRGILHETDYRPEANYSLSSDVVLLCDFRQKEDETSFDQSPLARQAILRGAEWKPLAKAPW